VVHVYSSSGPVSNVVPFIKREPTARAMRQNTLFSSGPDAACALSGSTYILESG
jgi:hypothetical protein